MRIVHGPHSQGPHLHFAGYRILRLSPEGSSGTDTSSRTAIRALVATQVQIFRGARTPMTHENSCSLLYPGPGCYVEFVRKGRVVKGERNGERSITIFTYLVGMIFHTKGQHRRGRGSESVNVKRIYWFNLTFHIHSYI